MVHSTPPLTATQMPLSLGHANVPPRPRVTRRQFKNKTTHRHQRRGVEWIEKKQHCTGDAATRKIRKWIKPTHCMLYHQAFRILQCLLANTLKYYVLYYRTIAPKSHKPPIYCNMILECPLLKITDSNDLRNLGSLGVWRDVLYGHSTESNTRRYPRPIVKVAPSVTRLVSE